MKKISTQKKIILKTFYLVVLGSMFTFNVSAQSFVEEFDDITTLWTTGWDSINHSAPHGGTTWFQGNGAGVFASYSGIDVNSYIGANYNSTGSTGTISTWLIAPMVTLNNGDLISFYTRKTDSVATNYADRLQVLLSTSGASANVGTTETDMGDFTTVLADINPTLSNIGYPTGYPYVWTQITLTVTGLSGPTPGRFAFRYFVTGAGLNGTNSDYIGIDLVSYTSAAGIQNPVQNINATLFPNPSNGSFRVRFTSEKSQEGVLEVSNDLGQVVYSENMIVSPGLTNHFVDLKQLPAGVYSVKVKTTGGMFNQKLVIQN